MSGAEVISTENDSIQYAGFWPRFDAFLLDFIIIVPVNFLSLWISQHYRGFIHYHLQSAFIALFYHVYLVRRFGGTPGKLIVGIRIRKITGEAVGYREAVLRYAPEFLLGFLMSIVLFNASFHLSHEEYRALSLFDRMHRLSELAPPWYVFVRIVNQIWIWSEFIVMLTNRKRRALHDFIAGTIVVYRNELAGNAR